MDDSRSMVARSGVRDSARISADYQGKEIMKLRRARECKEKRGAPERGYPPLGLGRLPGSTVSMNSWNELLRECPHVIL